MPLLRLRILLIIISLITVILIIRMTYLITLNPEDYRILENGDFTIKRGEILDRNGRLLAVSDELPSVYANPADIKSANDTARRLSSILNIPVAEILDKFRQKRSFVWIKRQIALEQADRIKALKLSGIGLKDEYKRFYPNNKLASQVLGFCNIDGMGEEGIEKTMDSFLIQDRNQTNLDNEDTDKEGLNVVLTLDSYLQAVAEESIRETVLTENADFGSLIFLDGQTGDILSMANFPDFNPNFYKNFNQSDFRNNSIFFQYEPGSIMKIFAIGALLDLNKINRSDFFYCNGAYQSHDITVKCTGVHGNINYYDIIKYSCNAAMLHAAERIENRELYHYLHLLDFGTRTTILLPGEQPGILRDIQKWNFRSMLAIPIGQEMSVNALQIVKAATVYVNDGLLMEPHIVNLVIDKYGKIIKNNNPKAIRRVFRTGIAAEILKAMKSSTDAGGTVKRLNLPGVTFGAKSGTGQIYDLITQSYSITDVTTSLLAIFPVEKPRYILYVVLHKPKGKVQWGGIICANTMNQFLNKLTGYLNFENKNSWSIMEKDLKVNQGYQKMGNLPGRMPNLIGLSAGEAMEIFSQSDLEIKIYGSGCVTRQFPVENEMINQRSIIKLYLEN